MPNLTDPIGDMLTRIRNAVAVKHSSLSMPISRTKLSIAQILKREGYIRELEILNTRPQGTLRIHLSYRDGRDSSLSGLKRVSRPGLRVYVGKGEIPRVYGGLGTAILSSSKGIVTGRDAWRQGIGGELLCYVW